MNGRAYKRRIEYAPLMIAFSVFFFLRPFFMWGISKYIELGLVPALYLSAILPNLRLRKNDFLMLLSFFALFLFLIVIQNYNLSYSLFLLSLVFVPFLDVEVFYKSLHYFEILLAVVLAGGIVFRLALLFNVPLPSYQVMSMNSLEFALGYTAYPPFLALNNADILSYFRFAGPFDEPGVVGTVALLVLFIEKYNLRKWPLIIIFISALLSLSFAFIGGTLFFVFARLVRKPVYAFVFGLLLFGAYQATKDIPLLQEAVYSRMVWDEEEGTLSGDNRAGDKLKTYVKGIRGTSEYFFGDHRVTEDEFSGRSILHAVLWYGFLFCFFYMIWLFGYSRVKRISLFDTIVCLLLIFLVLYQRPNFIHFAYIFLYTALLRAWGFEKELS